MGAFWDGRSPSLLLAPGGKSDVCVRTRVRGGVRLHLLSTQEPAWVPALRPHPPAALAPWMCLATRMPAVLVVQASWCSPHHGHGDTAACHLTSSPPQDPSPSLPWVPQELSLSFTGR